MSSLRDWLVRRGMNYASATDLVCCVILGGPLVFLVALLVFSAR